MGSLKKMWLYTQNNEVLGKVSSKAFNIISGNRKKIKGKSNSIIHPQTYLKRSSITILGNNNTVIIKKNTVLINTGILIIGNNHRIEIGEKCIIKNSGFIFEDNGCEISIGHSTTAEGVQVASLEPGSRVSIGNDCMFSAIISIRNSDSHSIIDAGTKERINMAKDVTIGNHVWVAEGVKILKGSVIEDNCIIGIGSIVTNYIPHNSLVAGIPARVIKKNVDWKRERIPNSDSVNVK